jgi:hypothetical protein
VALSGLYLVLSALISYAVGGYVAGRMRSSLSGGTPDEMEFRDGVHGAAAWVLATLVTALIAFGGAQSLMRLAAPSSGSAGPSASVGGENIIAYDIDRLFRGVRADLDMEYTLAEAGRILLSASSHRGMPPEDRTELVRLVTARTGLAQPEAERRVDDVNARARENVGRARKSAVIMAFSAGAAALLGLAAAWFAAGEGGKHRDGMPPSLLWGRQRPLTRGQGKSRMNVRPSRRLCKQRCSNLIAGSWKSVTGGIMKKSAKRAKPKSSSKRAGIKSKPKRSTKARTSSKSSSGARSKLKRAAKKAATAAVLAAGASALRTAVDELSPNQKEMEEVRSRTNRTEAIKAKSKR